MWPASPLELDKTLCEQCQPWAFHFHKYLEKMTSFSVYNHSTYWSCDSEKVAINSVKLLSCVQLFVTHGVQHIRFLCLLPVPGTYSNSCPSTRWCYPTISSSVISFSSYLQFFPASGYFPMIWFFTTGGWRIVFFLALASILPMNIQDWFPLGWTEWISLQSRTLLQLHNSKASILRCLYLYMTTGKTIALTRWTFVSKVMSLPFNMVSR